MRKLHLHIGSAKTGTTSIQNTFFQNRSQLDKQGYIYPGDEVKHHKLFFVTKSPEENWPAVYNKINKNVLKKEVETYLHKFEQDLKTFDKEYIISSEYLFISDEKYVRNIIQYLATFFAEIIVYIFVRDPTEYYRSFEAQKIHAKSYITSPNTFRYSFKDVIETWNNFCEVEVIEYNSHTNSCNSLCQKIGIDYNKLSLGNERSNQTESIEQLVLLEKIQKNIYPNIDNIYKNHLSIIWNSRALFKNKPTLKENIKPIIIANHKKDLKWLKKTYNINFIDKYSSENTIIKFPYSNNGKVTLRDVYKVNEQAVELYEAMLIDVLLKKIWESKIN